MKTTILFFVMFVFVCPLFAQKSGKVTQSLSNPMIADSNSTIMIPVRYDASILASSKILSGNNYLANIIFYDFKSDTYKKLFSEDTYILDFSDRPSYYRYEKQSRPANITDQWILYLVSQDYNKNGKIDQDDACVLFVSDKQGNQLKELTSASENVVSFEVFDMQGFALVKIQKDTNSDKFFDNKDQEYYYVKLSFDNLQLGNRIELK